MSVAAYTTKLQALMRFHRALIETQWLSCAERIMKQYRKPDGGS